MLTTNVNKGSVIWTLTIIAIAAIFILAVLVSYQIVTGKMNFLVGTIGDFFKF